MKSRAKKRAGTNEGTVSPARMPKKKIAKGQRPAAKEWSNAELRGLDERVMRETRRRQKVRDAEEQPPAIEETRDWTEQRLHAQDDFVLRQTEWRRNRAERQENADEIAAGLTGTAKAEKRLPAADYVFPTGRIGIHSQTGSAMIGRARGESDPLFSGVSWQLIQNLPVGIALIARIDPDDVRTWRIAAANKTARDVIGQSLVDFLLTRVAKSFPFQQKMEAIYEGIVQQGERRDLHWQVHEAGGIRRTYSVTGFAVPPKYLGLLVQDVSAFREARGALVEHQYRSYEISEAIETFLWKGDPETLETRWVSSEAANLLGYWPERWLSMPNFWLDHIDARDREMVERTIRQSYQQDREMVERTIRHRVRLHGAKFDYRMKAADGQTKWLHAVLHMSETETGQPELMGVMVDITARKQAEEAAHELSRKLLLSQDEERRHVARELHDSLGQYLSVLGMNIGTLSRTVLGLRPEQEVMFAETTDLLETCSRELRTLSYLMHPPMLDEVGLVPALEWYAAGFSERSKIQAQVDAQQIETRLPKPVEMAFFRITQEALTNIYRHSRSNTAEIRVKEHDGGITLQIEDTGAGLDEHLLEGIVSGNADAKGVGIRGMRERMREMGGTLAVASSKKGTTISAHIPRTASVFAKQKQDEEELYARRKRRKPGRRLP